MRKLRSIQRLCGDMSRRVMRKLRSIQRRCGDRSRRVMRKLRSIQRQGPTGLLCTEARAERPPLYGGKGNGGRYLRLRRWIGKAEVGRLWLHSGLRQSGRPLSGPALTRGSKPRSIQRLCGDRSRRVMRKLRSIQRQCGDRSRRVMRKLRSIQRRCGDISRRVMRKLRSIQRQGLTVLLYTEARATAGVSSLTAVDWSGRGGAVVAALGQAQENNIRKETGSKRREYLGPACRTRELVPS